MKKIKATSAFAVDGKVVRAGETRRLDDKLAADLIRRGKAVSAIDDAELDAAVSVDDGAGAAKPKRAAKQEGAANAG